MMIVVKLATEAVTWSSWLWRHREDFGPVLQKLGEVGDFAQAALTNPDGALRHIGNALVFGRPEGGEQEHQAFALLREHVARAGMEGRS